MMMKIQKKRLAIAVAGAVSLVASTAQAEDFTASATLQNTLTVVSLADFDIGTVFATSTGAAYSDGVGALVISPSGAVSAATAESATASLTSLTTPVGAQGSVAMTSDFELTLPNTSSVLAAEFDDGGGTGTDGADIITMLTVGTELVHESANPAVPSLWLMHFTVEAVSGGSVLPDTTSEAGVFNVTQDFGETEFVFNIGGTLTTEPTDGGALTYQEGIYSGTFEVLAAY